MIECATRLSRFSFFISITFPLVLWYREGLVWRVTRWGWNLYVPTFLLICQIEWSAVWIHGSVLLQQGDIGASGARVISCLHTCFLFISYYILHCTYSQGLHTVVNFLPSLTSKHSGCERSNWQEWNWRTKGESSCDKVKDIPWLLYVKYADMISFVKSSG